MNYDMRQHNLIFWSKKIIFNDEQERLFLSHELIQYEIKQK